MRTATTSRHRLRMVSEYVSWAPGSHVGMAMTEGPWCFEVPAGSWRFTPDGDGGTRAVWRYVFRCRIAGFAAGCADPVVLAGVDRR